MREKFTIRTITQLIVHTFSMISAYLVALNLEIALFGMLMFATSLIGLFSLLVPLGFSSIYFQHKEDDDFDEHFTILFVFKTILIMANYLPLFIILFFIDFGVNMILLILLISAILSQFSESFHVHLHCKMKVFKADIPIFLISIIESIGRIFIALNMAVIKDILIVLTLYQVFFCLIRLISLLFLSRRDYLLKKLNTNLMKQYFKDSKPLIIGKIVAVISINLGKIFLDISYGHEALAHYNLIDGYIITFLLLITGSVDTLYLSLYSSLFSQNNNKQVEKIANRIEKYSSIIFLFIIILVFLNGQLLFELLLPNYLPSVIFLYILIFSPFLAGINRPYSTQLIPGKKQNVVAIYSSVKVSILIFLTILIVPKTLFSLNMLALGSIGLAFISLMPWVVDFFFYRYFSKKFFNISSYKRIYTHLIVAFISFILTYFIKEIFLTNQFINHGLLLIISSSLLFCFYISQLWLLKELKIEDLKFIKSLLSLKSYKDSLFNELT